MSYDQYVITTFIKAGEKIIPVLVSVAIGYVVFIKLPFWFFRNTLKEAKRQVPDELPKFPDEVKVMRLEEKIRRDAEELRKEQQHKERPKTENKKTQTEEPKKEKKREEARREPPRPQAERAPSPESIFELKPGEKLDQVQLKSRYRELLKQSHPDRVASMGPEFRKLAEKKTKEINDAYEKLKKKAA